MDGDEMVSTTLGIREIPRLDRIVMAIFAVPTADDMTQVDPTIHLFDARDTQGQLGTFDHPGILEDLQVQG